MSYTPVQPYIHAWRVDTGADLGGTKNVLSFSLKRGLDGEETLTFEIATIDNDAVPVSMDPVAAAIIQAGGGISSDPTQVIPVLVAFSLDGGISFDCRKMIEQPHTVLDVTGYTVTESGDGLWTGEMQTLVDRLTFQSVKISDLLNHPSGTALPLPTPAANTSNGIGNPKILEALKGYLQTEPGNPAWAGRSLIEMAGVISTSIGDIQVDADENASPIGNAVINAINAALGAAPGSPHAGASVATDPLGSHAHFVADSSDASAGNLGAVVAAAEGTSVPSGPSVTVGSVGTFPLDIGSTTTSVLTFDLDAEDNPDYAHGSASRAQLLAPIDRTTNLGDTRAMATIIGGLNNHGFPDYATLVDAVCINNVGGTGWNASLAIVAARGTTGIKGNGQGGVYYWYEGQAYQFSQNLTPYSLWWDGRNSTPYLYVGTDQGVFRCPGTVTGNQAPAPDPAFQQWEHVGGNASATPPTTGLNGEIDKVICDLGLIIAHQTRGTTNGLFVHPTMSWDTPSPGSGDTAGYSGWTALHTDSTNDTVLDFCFHTTTAAGSPTPDGELVYVTQEQDTVITVRNSIATPAQSQAAPFSSGTTINNTTITGLDYTPTGTVIRTLGGALGLYYLPVGGSVVKMHSTGLVDANGPVNVNKVVGVDGYSIAGSAPIYLFACTDAGLFYNTTADGSAAWTALSAQCGLSDQALIGVAIGKQQTLLNRLATRFFALTNRDLFVSNSDALYFDAYLEEKVNCVPFWMAAADEAMSGTAGGHGGLPGTDVVALYSSLTSPYTTSSINAFTPGAALPIPAGSLFTLPPNWVWLLPLDEHNKRTIRLMDLGSHSPYFGAHPGEVAEIEASSSTSAAVASARLAYMHVRWLMEYSRIQTTFTLHSFFNHTTAKLRALRPTQKTALNINRPLVGLSYSTFTVYCLDHQLDWARGQQYIATTTNVSTLLRKAPPQDKDFAAMVGYVLGRVNRYKHGRR